MFVTACNLLRIISVPMLTSCLWLCVEFVVYGSMRMEDEVRKFPIIPTLGDTQKNTLECPGVRHYSM